MPDYETISVEQDAQGIAEAPQSDEVQEAQSAPSQEPRRGSVEYNWAEARRKMDALERQNRELREGLEALNNRPTPEDDELDKLGDDDIVTKRQVRKLTDSQARRIAAEAIQQYKASTVEERIKSRYSDFDSVVTPENIELLKQQKPSLALSLAHTPDPYAQAEAAYEAIKMAGIAGEQPMRNTDKERAQKNAQKPLSVNAVVNKSTPLGNAHLFENGLTPELKAQLWREMEECRKRA
jgi:hypothetical protein